MARPRAGDVMPWIVASRCPDHNGRGGNVGGQGMRAIVVALLLMTHAVWAADFDPALVDAARVRGRRPGIPA